MPLKESDLLNVTAAERRVLKLQHYLDNLPGRLPLQWTYAHPTRGQIGVRVTGVGYKDDKLRLDVEAALANGKRLAVASPMYIINPPMRARTGRVTVVNGENVTESEWNPLVAIRQDVEHTVGLMPALLNGQVVDDLDPTLTVYCDAHTESTTVDGQAVRHGVDEAFGTIRAGAGTWGGDNFANDSYAYLLASTTSNQFAQLTRCFFLFDTGTIGSADTVSSAIMSLYGSAKESGLGSTNMDIVGSTPASNTAIVAADYSQLNTTVHGTISYASYSASAYNDITLATTAVTKAGITKLGTRLAWDTGNSFGGAWSGGARSWYKGYFAEQAGTTNDPKLVVVYATPSSVVINPLSIMQSRLL